MTIELRPISEFIGFKPDEFCADPMYWALKSGFYVKAMEEAKELASDHKGICVAIVHDELLGTYALTEFALGWDKKFIFFNAKEKKNSAEADVRVVTYNHVGKSPRILSERLLKYQPGGIA